MTDQPNQKFENDDEEPKWFNEFIEDYDYQSPKPGQLIEGTILSLEEDAILVDIGVKRDAVVPAKDLSLVEESTLKQLSIGDQVFVYVLNRPGEDRELLVSLSKGIEYESWERAEQYLNNGTPLDLEIVSHNRGGLIVEFETLRGFLPYSQVPGLRGIRNPRMAERLKKELVGTTMSMKVIEVVRDRNRLIFSATAAEKEKRQKRLQELHKGDIINGKIVNIVDFGIFVDLDGIDGLVHISELEWQRIKHPSAVCKIGEEIEVQVLGVDVERERVSLSRKALLPSPWEIPEDLPKVGDCIEGRVAKIVNFGAFIELPIGIEGLVHISQLGYTHSENPNSAVKRGENVIVRVLDVSPERRRISLSMRQVPREIQIAWAMEHFDIGEIEEIDEIDIGDADSQEEAVIPDGIETPEKESDEKHKSNGEVEVDFKSPELSLTEQDGGDIDTTSQSETQQSEIDEKQDSIDNSLSRETSVDENKAIIVDQNHQEESQMNDFDKVIEVDLDSGSDNEPSIEIP